ncbi:TPA: hypothetical protein DEP90_00590 [Patescibacteria group bacterium]|nr:hypothetical protein [Patescibacteria group bacterium]
MKVIQLLIVFLRYVPYTLLLPILITNLLFPAFYKADDFSYIPKDYSQDIIEGGGVSISIYEFNNI